jgi:hypothetical protein
MRLALWFRVQRQIHDLGDFSSLIDGVRPRPVATSPNPISPSFSN